LNVLQSRNRDNNRAATTYFYENLVGRFEAVVLSSTKLIE